MHVLPTVQTLLEHSIDYAGLFPPASLDLEIALNNYRRYQYSDHAWLLGKFVLPASHLNSFRAFDHAQQIPLTLLVANPDLPNLDALRIDSAEIKWGALGTETSQSLPAHIPRYMEVPVDADLPNKLASLAEAGEHAKIRTGGVEESMIPSNRDVATFLIECNKAHVAFKATAGLHHGLCGRYPLTYETYASSGRMHGFLNVFVAAGLVFRGAVAEDIMPLLEEAAPRAITFEQKSVHWQNLELKLDEIEEVRRQFIHSFGSCSFEEPVEELKTLGLL